MIRELKPLFQGIGEVKDYEFRLIRSAEWGFLYEVSNGDRKHYEVFKRRVNRRFATVSYPTSKAFGKWAWTYTVFRFAVKKYKELEVEFKLKDNE